MLYSLAFKREFMYSTMDFEKIKQSILSKLNEFEVISKETELRKGLSKVLSNKDKFPILPKLL